jgi:DNA-binding response OmpR family regulator
MKTLLIVDDDLSLQRLYKEEFEGDGYRVLLASSGVEALELARTRTVDLVIMDIRLDDLGALDGLTTMRRILERDPRVPVILNSAYPSFKTDFASWSAEAYVVKSGDLTELKGEVTRVLSEKGTAAGGTAAGESGREIV